MGQARAEESSRLVLRQVWGLRRMAGRSRGEELLSYLLLEGEEVEEVSLGASS